jgi:hypothetical protein
MTIKQVTMLMTGVLVFGYAPAVLAQDNDASAANWNQVAQCAKQSGAKARHACLDQLLRDKGLIDSAKETAEARDAFGKSSRADTSPTQAPPPAPPMPTTAKAAPPRPAPTAPQETKISALQTTIARSRLGGDRKLLVTTAEGAIWQQTETLDLRVFPQKGDAFEIEEAALGSHRCKLGRSKVFRCHRVN